MTESQRAEARHNWRICRCLPCRSAYSDYCRGRYLARAKGETNLVPIKRAKQLLLQFESGHDAARVIGIHQSTVSRILASKVKRIRVETEKRILEAVAA